MQAMQALGGMRGARPSAEEMFSKIDSNQDGSIDKAEFSDFGAQMASQAKSAGQQIPSGEQLFSRIDADGDGALTSNELESFHADMGARMAQRFASGGSSDSLLKLIAGDTDEQATGSSLSSLARSYQVSSQYATSSLLELIG